jgi:hypothetical protein
LQIIADTSYTSDYGHCVEAVQALPAMSHPGWD